MTRRSIPSLTALQAFDAAARLLSFTKAADELYLTQSAISRQIQSLEDAVGTRLFHRAANRLVLTEAGASYHDEISPLLERIRNATLRLMAFKGEGGSLRLSVLPTLGMKWFVPRLPDFLRGHPHVQVSLSTRVTPPDWREDAFDAAIQYGEPGWSGLVAVQLMGEELVAVAAPGLLEDGRDLAQLPLLQQATRAQAWEDWFAASDVRHPHPYGGLRFEQFSHVIQAAVAGLGLALVPRFLVDQDLAEGRLRLASTTSLYRDCAYYLVYPQSKHQNPAVIAFRGWLQAQAASFWAAQRGG